MRLFAPVEFVDLFCGESQLGDDIRVGGIAVEGIGLRRNIVAIFLPETVEIILHMETVHALGRTVDVIILTTVVTVDGEAVFKAVAHFGSAQWDETVGIREVPGGYYTGRHISNAIRKVINDKDDSRETIIDYSIKIDEEITKKRIEFGMPVYEKEE